MPAMVLYCLNELIIYCVYEIETNTIIRYGGNAYKLTILHKLHGTKEQTAHKLKMKIQIQLVKLGTTSIC